jgi:iron(III) transport system permease protein
VSPAAGWLRALRSVVLPLLWPTLAGTWTLVFVLALQEVSASILLYTSHSTVLSVAVFDLWEAGNVNGLAALSVLQLFVTFLALLVVSRVRRREIAA